MLTPNNMGDIQRLGKVHSSKYLNETSLLMVCFCDLMDKLVNFKSLGLLSVYRLE